MRMQKIDKSYYKLTDIGDVNMFGECESVLEVLEDKRIFNIILDEDTQEFVITEMCDEWFSHKLGVKELRQLAELFNKMADYTKKIKGSDQH